jgi:hypothetical protein
MGHGYAPLRHRTLRILPGDLSKSLPRLLILERMQQRHRTIEILTEIGSTRSQEVNRTNFFLGERVMMFFLAKRQRSEE